MLFPKRFSRWTMSGKKETIDGLSASSIFADIPEETLREFSEIAEDRVVPAHTMIFRQGDPGDRFYVINAGRVRVFRKGKRDLKTELIQLGPGDFFGEMALFAGRPRSAYVEAMEETHLIMISKDEFDRIVSDYPSVSIGLVKEISNWLLRDDLRLEREQERRFRVPRLSCFDLFVVLSLSLLFGIVFNLSNPNGVRIIPQFLTTELISTVSAAEAISKHVDGKALFVDARPSSVFEQQRIKDAINVPLALFDIIYMMELGEMDGEKEIILYGRTISRLYDEQVASKLILRGHKNTKVLEGGLSEWKKAGYPVEP
jgi:CRP-like cAMP-binding protein/rhodanese-related sulfurtransferase